MTQTYTTSHDRPFRFGSQSLGSCYHCELYTAAAAAAADDDDDDIQDKNSVSTYAIYAEVETRQKTMRICADSFHENWAQAHCRLISTKTI